MPNRNENSAAAMIGVGLCDLLLVLFIGLKLCGVIDWSWWWVTAPFWGQFALGALFSIAFVIYLMIDNRVKNAESKKSKKENKN